MGIAAGWSHKQLVKRLATVQAQVNDGWKSSPLAMSKQFDDIGSGDRDRTVKWLMQLTLEFRFYPDTYFLSVNILDRFITCVKAHPKYLRCIAITCLYLASKMVEEEEIIPCTKDLIETSQCCCRVADVLRMERIILEKLQWDLCTTTSLQYLHVFHAVANQNADDMKHVQRNLLKLTHALVRVVSHYPIFISFSSATLALAVFSVDLEESCNADWVNLTLKMQALANLDTDVVMKCRMMVRRYVLSTRPMSNHHNNNSAFVLNVPNLTNTDFNSKQVSQQQQAQTCGKRKASSEMIWQVDGGDSGETTDNSIKKSHLYTSSSGADDSGIHYDDDDDVDHHDDTIGDSDVTLTASEGEDEFDDDEHVVMSDDVKVPAMPTYADIVKLKAGPWHQQQNKGRSCSPQQPPPPPLVYHHEVEQELSDVTNVLVDDMMNAASDDDDNDVAAAAGDGNSLPQCRFVTASSASC